MALLLLDDDGDLARALDLEVEERVALVDEDACAMGVRLEGAGRLAGRVDDAGDEPVAAQPAGRGGSRTRCVRRPSGWGVKLPCGAAW